MRTVRCLVWGFAAMLLPVGSVAAAESAAKAAAATPEGKKYEDEVATAFGRDQGKSIQACARDVKRPDLSDFRVFVRVSASGQVEEALVKAWKVRAPPQADSWVSIPVELKRK